VPRTSQPRASVVAGVGIGIGIGIGIGSSLRHEHVRHHQFIGDAAQITPVLFIHSQWTNLWTQPQTKTATSRSQQDPPLVPRRTCVQPPVQHALGTRTTSGTTRTQ
jgi:hypothetical protein